MGQMAGLLVVLAIGVLAAGPLALILTLVLFNKIGKLEDKIRWLSSGRPVSAPPRQISAPIAEPVPQPTQPTLQAPVTAPMAPRPVEPVPATPQASPPPPAPPAPKVFDVPIPTPPVSRPAAPKLLRVGLEQKIGTKILPIAAIITVIVGVGFSLKYVYDNAWFGPTARVCVVAVGGLVAMAVGEITRRRGYEIVAKGTTAMGFALLYAAVFSASRVYFLIETQTAFVLAIAITAGAMAYAVALNEVVIAFLSLLGGYLSPIVITTGQNLAMPLFSYLLALAAGVLGCAMFRRWRAVNWIAMAGTYLLYTGWFEKFYTPDQMPLALSWLGVFGGLFLLQPILYGLKQQIAARAEDVGLVVANSAAVFYYLWRILYAEHPQAQAFAAATVGAVHLLLMAAVMVRCRNDRKLQAALGVLGTAFITTAIPLYFAALNPTLLIWAVEAVALTFIGIRYRSLWIKTMALIVTAIAALGLFYHLPLHAGTETFRIVFNAPFGTWMFIAAAILVCHALWRWMAEAQNEDGRFATQIYYAAGVVLAAIGWAMEWYADCRWHVTGSVGDANFLLGTILLLAAVVMVFLARPLPPKGEMVRALGVLVALGGAVFVVISRKDVHTAAFAVFINVPFAITAMFVAAMMAGAWCIRRAVPDQNGWANIPAAMVLAGLVLVWIVLSQEVYLYWACRNTFAGPVDNWRFSAQMLMSVAWAIYAAALVVGGFVFRAHGVRYLSLLIFAVLLAKIFLKDTVTLRIEYRIAAFLTTGLILVSISFLYQFLKKKGFFEEKSPTPVNEVNE